MRVSLVTCLTLLEYRQRDMRWGQELLTDWHISETEIRRFVFGVRVVGTTDESYT